MKRLLVLLSLWLLPLAHAAGTETEDAATKRAAVLRALEKGILNVYDIPFTTCVSLDLWEPIDKILEANARTVIRRRLPGRYFSRPYVVEGDIWVFHNTNKPETHINLFDPDSLKPVRSITNAEYAEYEGGIRSVQGAKIVSGGSDNNVDAVVIWDISTNKVETVRLEEGHYVTALQGGAERLFAGSCGGMVNAWRLDSLDFIGAYKTSDEANVDWEVFNRKPCLSQLHLFGDQLIAAGDRKIFVWDVETRERTDEYPKRLPHSLITFFRDRMVEYNDNQVAISELGTDMPARRFKTPKPIADLIVTDQPVLPGHDRPVIILSMRHNSGFRFYDFDTLSLLAEKPFRGSALQVHGHALFATDDRSLYRYDIHKQAPEKYRAFLETINLETLPLPAHTYEKLLARARSYPGAIDPNLLASSYLKQHGIEIHYDFKFGEIGTRRINGGGNGSGGHTEEMFGYKLVYDLTNRSSNGYYMTLMFEWSGAYGVADPEDVVEEEKTHWENFLIPPNEGVGKGVLIVGEKEPERLYVYPTKLERMPEGYYEGLQIALDPEQTNLPLIEKYLKDKRTKKWHEQLELRKSAILSERILPLP